MGAQPQVLPAPLPLLATVCDWEDITTGYTCTVEQFAGSWVDQLTQHESEHGLLRYGSTGSRNPPGRVRVVACPMARNRNYIRQEYTVLTVVCLCVCPCVCVSMSTQSHWFELAVWRIVRREMYSNRVWKVDIISVWTEYCWKRRFIGFLVIVIFKIEVRFFLQNITVISRKMDLPALPQYAVQRWRHGIGQQRDHSFVVIVLQIHLADICTLWAPSSFTVVFMWLVDVEIWHARIMEDCATFGEFILFDGLWRFGGTETSSFHRRCYALWLDDKLVVASQ